MLEKEKHLKYNRKFPANPTKADRYGNQDSEYEINYI
jgi:hypothetical protein